MAIAENILAKFRYIGEQSNISYSQISEISQISQSEEEEEKLFTIKDAENYIEDFSVKENDEIVANYKQNQSQSQNEDTSKSITYLPVAEIFPNPYQPRKYFNDEMLLELANSIEKYGVMQPINVRIVNGYYELISGERRLRASKHLNISTIPAIIVNITDKESSFLALIENLQRENLNFLEEAVGYVNLLNEFDLTQEELSRQIGKSQSAIANKIRILKLPSHILDNLLKNNFTERHARALLKLNDHSMQDEVVKYIIDNNYTVKETESYIECVLSGKTSGQSKKKNAKSKLKPFVKDIRLFTNTIKQAITIMNNSGVTTDYEMEESEGGYDIHIKITTSV